MQQGVQGAEGGHEHQAEGHQHLQEAKTGLPGTGTTSKGEMGGGGPMQKTASPIPRDNIKNQHSAREKVDKEKSKHPYWLKKRRGMGKPGGGGTISGQSYGIYCTFLQHFLKSAPT